MRRTAPATFRENCATGRCYVIPCRDAFRTTDALLGPAPHNIEPRVVLEATVMKAKSHRKAKAYLVNAKTILRLRDREIAKAPVINSLSCPDSQRGYRHPIDEFVDWYCSEPRLSFSKPSGTKCTWNRGTSLQEQSTSASVRCAVWHTKRRTAPFLCADLAAGIRRVKGVKKLGVRATG